MTISLVASDGREDAEAGNPNDGLAQLTLSGTEGNLQIVFATHRSSTQTPSIDGTGWSAAQLIETQIGNGSARRAVVGWWREVPAAAAATVNAGWTADPGAVVGVGFEFSTDTAGGTWSFDGWNSSDNGTSATTSLASGSVTPANNEAAAVVGLCARNGDVAAEDSYDSSFLTGPSSTSGAGANQLSGFSGYRIVDTTPAATSTTASWTTSALATSLIAAVSVSSGATPVGLASETDTAQPVTSAKAAQLGQPSETDTAQPVTTAKALTLAQTTETDTAQPITARKTHTIGQATETDQAQSVTSVGATPIGQTVETDTAQPITARKTITLGQPVETDAAQAVTLVVGTAVGQAVETDQAFAVTVLKTVTLGLAVETDTSLALVIADLSDPNPTKLSFREPAGITHREMFAITYQETPA